MPRLAALSDPPRVRVHRKCARHLLCYGAIILRMKNITLKLDDAVLDRVRHVAVDKHMSVSAWVQNMINREIDVQDLYEQDRKGALMVLKDGLPLGGTPLAREETHER